MFAHATRKQCLSEGVVDLVRTCMQKIFALEINLCATGMRSQSLDWKQRRRWAGVVAQQQVEFAPEIIVVSRARELCGQLLQRRDQCFRNVAAPELTPGSVFVRLTFSDHKWRCHVERSETSLVSSQAYRSRIDPRSFASLRMTLWGGLVSRRCAYHRAHGSDEIFDCVVVFHTRCAFNTAANIDGMRRHCLDRSTNIL